MFIQQSFKEPKIIMSKVYVPGTFFLRCEWSQVQETNVLTIKDMCQLNLNIPDNIIIGKPVRYNELEECRIYLFDEYKPRIRYKTKMFGPLNHSHTEFTMHSHDLKGTYVPYNMFYPTKYVFDIKQLYILEKMVYGTPYTPK